MLTYFYSGGTNFTLRLPLDAVIFEVCKVYYFQIVAR